jgi:hypothetical protein
MLRKDRTSQALVSTVMNFELHSIEKFPKYLSSYYYLKKESAARS